MQNRFLGWLFVGVLFAAISLRAQAPAAPAGGQGEFKTKGTILVAKVDGEVNMILEGVTTKLAINMPVSEKAKVVTANGASVVLVFSNGASTQLGSDTELVIEEYLQDPFAATVAVAKMVDEPSTSRTKLSLNKGELVGNVKKLKYDRGSAFTVQTPVGAAGIRGTTFRIVFRPQGTGQAFFTLSTAIGQVEFSQPNQNGGTQTNPNTTGTQQNNTQPGNTQTQTPTETTSGPNLTGSGTAKVDVPPGQEISFVVNATTNAQGQLVVTVVPTPTSTTSISSANLQAVAQIAADIAAAVQQTTFTPPPTTGTGGTGNSQGGESGGSTGGSPGGSTTGGTPPSGSTTQNISGPNFEGQVTNNPPAGQNQPPASQQVRQSTLSTP